MTRYTPWSRKTKAGAALLIVAAAAGLGQERLAHASSAVDPPPPALEPDGSWVPELPVSTLTVPIRYDLTTIMEAVEGAIPPSYGSLSERIPTEDNDRVHVAFQVTRNPLRTSFIADRVRITTVLNYRARAWYDPPLLPEVRSTCGTAEEPLRAVASISARVWLSPTWQLRSDGRVDHIGPLAEGDRDRCTLTPLRVDVTERVMGAARVALTANLPTLEQALSRVDVRSRFASWWAALAAPIRLSDDVWLLIDPVGVHRGPTRGRGAILTAEVGLAARPRIVYGEAPTQEPPPLPELSEGLEGEGLHIRASGTADYATASLRLTEALRGREILHQGQTLSLQEVDVSGIGSGRLTLDVHFTGSARGHIYLVGTPQFDSVSGEIYVPDLSFDVETRNLLLQGLAWVGEEEILEFFRRSARWRIDDLARFAGAQLTSGLNRDLTPEVRLEGEVEWVRILGVYPLIESLVVQAEARAMASLIISEAVSAS